MDNPFATENQAETIIKRLGLKEDMIVADIGCGPGRITIPLAKQLSTGKVFAIDTQQAMLDKVKTKAIQSNINNIEYQHTTIASDELTLTKLDRIIMINILGEIPQQLEAIKQVSKYLKRGGILSISETIFDPHFQRLGKVKKLMNEAGLQEKAVFSSCCAYTAHFELTNLNS